MQLKPIYETSTIKFSNPIVQENIKLKSISEKEKGEAGIIPFGIYKVIKWELIRQNAALVISSLIFITGLVFSLLYVFVWKAGWASQIIPVLVMLFAIYKLINTLIEKKYVQNSVRLYREDLKYSLASLPPFIPKLYKVLHVKQIRHNWLTFFVVFYGGILTLLLWWLKDVNWWIFNFHDWVLKLFSDPSLMTWIFAGSLVFILLIHVVMLIQRKKKILEIEAFAGSKIIETSQIDEMSARMNKFYRRCFFLSLLTLLIIPITIKIILKLLKLRK